MCLNLIHKSLSRRYSLWAVNSILFWQVKKISVKPKERKNQMTLPTETIVKEKKNTQCDFQGSLHPNPVRDLLIILLYVGDLEPHNNNNNMKKK